MMALDLEMIAATVSAYVTLEELSQLEIANCSVQQALFEGGSWGHCASCKLASKFILSPMQLRLGKDRERKELKALVASLLKVTIITEMPVPLENLKQAKELVTSVFRARGSAPDNLSAGGVFVATFRFTEEATCPIFGSLPCVSEPVMVHPLMAISLARGNKGRMFLKADSPRNFRSPLVIDVHALSQAFYLRFCGMRFEACGRWSPIPGVCPAGAAPALIDGLTCVVCIHDVASIDTSLQQQIRGYKTNIDSLQLDTVRW
eukprot:gnl/TRDRNA2_/TRDRNA2_91150_c0_seq1.p1 gnl/TRDRNA2_/TRDRNA2_91150_c0~~gnl/TRDRNA2_/TRDRNA2_91150_c0_seq1.p1  ORF type:complete len:262 (-),score=48.40 gnl/TRDRNA2_/TRDRNA2_91150_c0_seq1:73-858(-)